MSTSNIQEEVIVTDDAPQKIVRKVTRKIPPPVRDEPPQQVYEKKKTIFRSNQIIWYILGLIEVLLGFRFLLKLLGANQTVGFTNLIYSLTEPLVALFYGIIPTSSAGTSVVEGAIIIAALVYLCLAWGIVYLLDLFFPITPEDVEVQT